MGSLTNPRQRLRGEPLGVALRIGSTLAFAAMTACIKALGDAVPLGQVVFFRSAVALLPLVFFLWWTGDFPRGLATRRPFGHIARCLMGAVAMFTSFATLRYLPLAEATRASSPRGNNSPMSASPPMSCPPIAGKRTTAPAPTAPAARCSRWPRSMRA